MHICGAKAAIQVSGHRGFPLETCGNDKRARDQLRNPGSMVRCRGAFPGSVEESFVSCSERLSPFHPPSQQATARRPWRNAQQVSSEVLAPGFRSRKSCFGGVGKEDPLRRLSEASMLPAFVACRLLRRSRLGEVSPKTKKGPRLAGRGAPPQDTRHASFRSTNSKHKIKNSTFGSVPSVLISQPDSLP